MPSAKMEGKLTISQVLRFTKEKFPTRFVNAKRDSVKFIKIKSIKYYEKERPNLPVIKYEILSQSYPSYGNFLRDKRGRKRKRQRSIKHQYDTLFVFGNEGITLNTHKWLSSVGSMKRWRDAPQSMVGTIRKKTRDNWKKESIKHGTTKKAQNEWVQKKVKEHKKKAKYVDTGDYNARTLGINGDWIFRQSYTYYVNSHLIGRNYYGNVPSSKTNPQNIMFFNKHQISIIKVLMQKGILKN